jgi:O-glycosyl hydrolase
MAILAGPMATALLNPSETHQTIEGFGASQYYYSNWLTAHPNKEDIYVHLFDDLGLDILRLGNTFRPGTAFNRAVRSPVLIRHNLKKSSYAGF